MSKELERDAFRKFMVSNYNWPDGDEYWELNAKGDFIIDDIEDTFVLFRDARAALSTEAQGELSKIHHIALNPLDCDIAHQEGDALTVKLVKNMAWLIRDEWQDVSNPPESGATVLGRYDPPSYSPDSPIRYHVVRYEPDRKTSKWWKAYGMPSMVLAPTAWRYMDAARTGRDE